jgi:predicted ABC-type ATPase
MQKPNAFIFAGANASGKSTFIAHLKSQNIIYGEYINPDLILKEELKLNESYENYLKAFELAKQKREIAIRNKKDIILETVFSTEDKIDFLEQLKQNGYEITLFFTGTENADINVLYLKRRVEEGGHDVPIRKLLDRRKRGFKNIKKVLSRIDCIVFIDNSIINEPPIIVKSLYKNQICFINENDREINWVDDILKENLPIIDKNFVPKSHLELCYDIIDNSNNFYQTLKKDYYQKNQILK